MMSLLFAGLREHGRDWTKIAQLVGTKSEAQCKNFYFNYKKKFGLEALLEEYRRKKVRQNPEPQNASAKNSAGSGGEGNSPLLPAELLRVKVGLFLNENTRWLHGWISGPITCYLTSLQPLV